MIAPMFRDASYSRRGGVYFLGSAQLTKIGHSDDIAKRCIDIHYHSPVQLAIVAYILVPGPHASRATVESWVHGCLRGHRRHGEWFENGAVRAWLQDHYWRPVAPPYISGDDLTVMLNEDWPC